MKMKAAVLCLLPMALADFAETDNCDHQWCGNMNVPFPFRLSKSCAQNPGLLLSCNHTSGNLTLGDNIPVFNICVEDGTTIIGMYGTIDCYDKGGQGLKGSDPDHWINLGQQYTLSDNRNKLTVYGCDALLLYRTPPGLSGAL